MNEENKELNQTNPVENTQPASDDIEIVGSPSEPAAVPTGEPINPMDSVAAPVTEPTPVEEVAAPVVETPVAEPTLASEPVPVQEPVAEPAPVSEPVVETPASEPAPVTEPVTETPVVEPAPVQEPVVEAPTVEPVAAPVTEPAAPVEMTSNTETLTPEQPAPAPAPSPAPAPTVEPKKNNMTKIIIAVVAGLLVLGVAFYFIYTNVIMSKENIVKTNITNAIDFLSKNVETLNKKTVIFNPKTDAIGLTGKLNVSSNLKTDELDLTKLEKYDFNYKGVIDIKNNKASLNLGLDENKNELISLQGYIEGKTAYLKSKQISSYIYKMVLDKEIKDIDFGETLDYSNFKKVADKTKEVTLKSLDESRITKEVVTDTINGKQGNYSKVKYDFDENKFIKDLFQEYMNDEEILNTLAKMFTLTKEEMKTKLQDAINDIPQEEYILNIEIYSDSFSSSFKKMIIGDKAKSYFEIVRTDKNILNYKAISVTNGTETTVFSGTYNPTNKDFTFDMTSEGYSFNLSLKKEDEDKSNIAMKFSAEGTSLEITAIVENKVSGKTETFNVDLSITGTFDGESVTLKLKNDLMLTAGATVDSFDTASAKDVESMSQYELQSISTKLENIFTSRINEIYTPKRIYYYNNYNNYNYDYSYGNSYSNSYGTYSFDNF